MPGRASNKCTMRVWDSGDKTDCGRETVIANRCTRCRNNEAEWLKDELKELEQRMKDIRFRLDELGEFQID